MPMCRMFISISFSVPLQTFSKAPLPKLICVCAAGLVGELNHASPTAVWMNAVEGTAAHRGHWRSLPCTPTSSHNGEGCHCLFAFCTFSLCKILISAIFHYYIIITFKLSYNFWLCHLKNKMFFFRVFFHGDEIWVMSTKLHPWSSQSWAWNFHRWSVKILAESLKHISNSACTTLTKYSLGLSFCLSLY